MSTLKEKNEINKKEKKPMSQSYIVKTMNGMALGLFATLIIGTIIGTIVNLSFNDNTNSVYLLLIQLSNALKSLVGVGIGIGVAVSLDRKGLTMIALAAVGGIAGFNNLILEIVKFISDKVLPNNFIIWLEDNLNFAGRVDVVVCYLAVVFTDLIVSKIMVKKTPIDIILVPLTMSIVGFIVIFIITFPILILISGLGKLIVISTAAAPWLMGGIIALLMGMALTGPISSAAIAAALVLGSNSTVDPTIMGIAGGAALVGCCTQMLGFAIMSRKDNGIGVIVAIGIGTSMLQFKNVIKKPIIWAPTLIASVILGVLSAIVFEGHTTSAGSGMGTSGLVGQIETISSMGFNKDSILYILVLQIAGPIVLVWFIDVIFRKCGLIKKGDLTV